MSATVISDATPATSTEDELREKLLIAQNRIVVLERLVAELRGIPLSKRRHQATQANTVAKRQKIHAMTDGCCFFCSVPIDIKEMSVDHLVPASKGGSSRLTNLVPACFACNGKKGNNMPSAQQVERAYGLYMKVTRGGQTEMKGPMRFSPLVP